MLLASLIIHSCNTFLLVTTGYGSKMLSLENGWEERTHTKVLATGKGPKKLESPPSVKISITVSSLQAQSLTSIGSLLVLRVQCLSSQHGAHSPAGGTPCKRGKQKSTIMFCLSFHELRCSCFHGQAGLA